MKPFYERDGIQIYHGDAREILPALRRVDFICTDPPYGIRWDTDYRRFNHRGTRKSNNHFTRVRGDDVSFNPWPLLGYRFCVLFGWNHFSDKLPGGGLLVWDKRFNNGKAWLADAEIAWIKNRRGVYFFHRVWQGAQCRSRSHPCQKPVELFEYALRLFPSAQIACDPFMGSGTMLLAAKKLGRRAIGIEIERKYCRAAAQRLEGLK